MKKLFISLVLLCSGFGYSQITFEKGYFINNNGVRVECFIENQDWLNNPKGFAYKLLENDQSKNETFMGVREFGIDNVCQYNRFTVKVGRSDMTRSIAKNNILEWKEETLFLKALATGDANLYVLSEANTIIYFYQTNTAPIEQLIHLRHLDTDGYGIKENNQFRQQLLNNLKCGTSENDFKKLEYKKNALVSVFVKHNNCSNATSASKSVNFAEKNTCKVFSMKVTPGIYSASLSVKDPGSLYNVSSDFSAMVFKIGVEAEFMLPFNKNAWSLFLNPAYESFNTEKTFSRSDGFTTNPEIINYNAKIKYSSIEIPIGLRHYFFLNSSSRIFINAAYVVNVNLSGKIDFTNVQKVNANTSLDISGRSNFAIGAGYGYKEFSGEVRLNTAREVLSSYASWSGKYSTVGVVLGYRIF